MKLSREMRRKIARGKWPPTVNLSRNDVASFGRLCVYRRQAPPELRGGLERALVQTTNALAANPTGQKKMLAEISTSGK